MRQSLRHPLCPTGRSTILVAASAAVMLLSACKRVEESRAPDTRPVRTMRIEQHSALSTVVLTGTVQAQREINQSFRIDGRLIERSVNIGDEVRPGQVIARLDPVNEETALQAARARLTGALAQQAEAGGTYARVRGLVGTRAVSVQEF